MRRTLRCAALAVLTFAPAFAQPKNVEFFLTAGALRGGGDEGSPGSGGAFGGVLTIPLASKLAVDVDVQTTRLVREFSGPSTYYRVRRWVISPGLQYRFGSRRVYGFVGGGLGGEISRSVTVEGGLDYHRPGWQEIGPGVWETRAAWNRTTFHSRTGVVISPVNRLLVRVDLNAAWAHVSPNLGIKVGLGYRF